MNGFLEDATSALGMARAEALLRGDVQAAHRLGRLRSIVSDEAAYCDNLRLGLPPIPIKVAEWLPGRPDEDVMAQLGDAHHHQLERIEAVVA